MRALLRGLGWSFIGAGVLVLLFLVYLLGVTNLTAERAQRDLRDSFEQRYGGVEPSDLREEPEPASDASTLPGQPEAGPSPEPAPPVPPGEAYAALWFNRPGSEEPLVRKEPLFVVEGVSLDVLKRGPGHYPDTAAPGGEGNFVVSGHRTTYGAPFYHLDRVQPGDEVHVVDRAGQEWVYVVREQQVVEPTAMWVTGPDPLGTGTPTLTLTTCTPRFSAAQRLIVFAELAQRPPSA